jgi:non-ribosomal peptide synthetase-like protein
VNILRRREGVIERPANDLETTIHGAWSARFAGVEVSVTDDFFVDLGGHSMLAAQVITELRTKHNLTRASVRDLYAHRTIRAFALHLGAAPQEAAETSSDLRTPSQRVFDSVPKYERWATVAFQTIALFVYEAVLIAPVAFFVWLGMSVMAGTVDIGVAIWLGSIVGFAMWPTMLMISIAVKWLVAGRFKAGAYPVWGFTFCRWWVTNLFARLSWAHMFEGSPLMSLYFRLMGARVGKNVALSTSICSAFDLISIGDDSSIGAETHISGYRVEDGLLKLGRVDIGSDCFVGMHCSLGLNSRMESGARLDDMSQLDDDTTLESGAGLRGAPAAPAVVTVPEAPARKRSSEALFGFLHLALVYAMGYFLIIASLPGIALGAYLLLSDNIYLGALAVVAAVPLLVVWYIVCLVAVKKLVIGRIKPGRYPLRSASYLRLWFLRYMLANTRQILMPLYSTIYLPQLYRALGARIGSKAELSTVNQAVPDLIDVGEASFLADECVIGGIRIHNGVAELKSTTVGKRTFVGNSAMVRGGATVGDGVLLGVMSTLPVERDEIEANSQWLGSPGFALPRPKAENQFDETTTFKPDKKLLRLRAVIDAVRILLPGYLSIASLGGVIAFSAVGYSLLPWWAVALALPLVVNLVAVFTIFAVALIKRVVIGTFKPDVHPLWSPFVWLNDVINGVFEAVAAIAMSPFMGTPYLAPLLRMMGCKIGKWCFIDTTLFSEFDLVRVGDYASLNLGATLQTHLFEDRVMKSDTLTVGEGCSVGNMAIVLYSTEMQRGSWLGPLSVLMKGETLPPMSRWRGIPSEPMARPRLVVVEGKKPSEPLNASVAMAAAQ